MYTFLSEIYIKITLLYDLKPKLMAITINQSLKTWLVHNMFHFYFSDLRLKFMTALMLIVLTISIVITGLRFGASVLKDNFVAELSSHYQNSAEFLSFYGLLNFYLYAMAFVYSPSKNAVYGKCGPGAHPTIIRWNSKFDQNLQCSGLKCTLPITTKFCTCYDNVTIVTCAKFPCDRFSVF